MKPVVGAQPLHKLCTPCQILTKIELALHDCQLEYAFCFPDAYFNVLASIIIDKTKLDSIIIFFSFNLCWGLDKVE